MTFERIRPDSFRPAAGQRVIRRDEFATLVEANELVDEARRRAADILAEAERERALERERGYREGRERARGELVEQLAGMAAATVGYYRSVESQTADLVLATVRRVIGEFDNTELVLRLTRQALATVRGEQQVTLRVNPENLSALRETLLAQHPEIEFLEVVADDRLGRDQSVLESPLGVVDASLETQLAAIRRAIDSRLSVQGGEQTF